MSNPSQKLDKKDAPDPARSYERARPEAETGMGRLDTDAATPQKKGDAMHHAVPNQQPLRQINSDDVVNAAGGAVPGENLNAPPPGQRKPDDTSGRVLPSSRPAK